MTAPETGRIRLLLLEDQPLDAELIVREVRQAGLEPEVLRVETEADFTAALGTFAPDIILSDFTLPTFDGLSAIRVVQRVAPAIPVVVVTGSISEEVAVECIKAGAEDYILKDRMGRVGVAIRAALDRRKLAAAKRQADEEIRRLSLAMEQSPVSVVVTDTDGRIQYVNERFTEVSGYPAAEALGRNPRFLKSGYTRNAVHEELWNTLRAGQRWSGDLINRRKDGQLFRERVSISPVRDADGRVTHYIAVKEDVTSQRQRELELAAIAGVGRELDRALRTPGVGVADAAGQCLDAVLSATDADAGVVIGPREHDDALHVLAARGPWAASVGATVPPDAGPLGAVLQSGEPFHGEAGALGVLLADDPRAQGNWNIVGVRLTVPGSMPATLWVGRDLTRAESAPFLQWDLPVLQAAAMVLAGGVSQLQLMEQTNRRLSRLVAMQEIDQAIAASLDPRVTLNVVLDNVMAQLGADACDVLLLNPHLRVLEFGAGRGFPRHNHTPAPVPVGEGLAGLAVLERRLVSGADLPRRSIEEPHATLPNGFRSQHAVPLVTKGQVIGVLNVYHGQEIRPDPEWRDFLLAVAEQAAIGIENARLFQDLQRSNDELAVAYDATIEGWVRALDMRDEETEGHTQRVTTLTLDLARAMGIGESELVHLRRGALLHDIGKMGVPDVILRKPGPLTPEERALIEQHTTWAHEWLAPIRYLRPAMDIPYCHHEKWDGTGYPRGLRGEQIPLAARIFAVVDIYDAMRSDRVYRPAWPEDRVIAQIKELSGSHLDPQVVDVFLARVGRTVLEHAG